MNEKSDSSYIVEKSEDGRVAYFPVSENVLSLRQDYGKVRSRKNSAENLSRNAIMEIRPFSLKKQGPEKKQTETPVFGSEGAKQYRFNARNLTVAVLTLFFVSLTFGGSPVAVTETLSFFRDLEASRDNIFAAGFLAFRLNPGEVTEEISLGDTVVISPKFTPDTGTFPIQYRVSAEIVGEATPLCSLLQAVGTSSPLVYSGLLAELTTEPADTIGNGHLEVTLPQAEDLEDGATCTVDVVYRGWHPGAPENTGYTDEESDRFTFVFKALPEALTAVSSGGSEPDETQAPEELENVAPEELAATDGASSNDDSADASEDTAENDIETPAPDPVVENYSPSGGSPSPQIETQADPGSEAESETPAEAPPGNEPVEKPAPEEAPAPAESIPPTVENSPAETPPAETPPPADIPPPSEA